MLPTRVWLYLGQGLWLRWFIAALGLLALYAVVDAIELGAVGGTAALLSWIACRAPFAAACLLPVAAVIAALTALSSWRCQGEWEALLGSGLRPWVLLLSVLPMAAATALLSLWLSGGEAASSACAKVGPAVSSERQGWSACGQSLGHGTGDSLRVRIDLDAGGVPRQYWANGPRPGGQPIDERWDQEGWRAGAGAHALPAACGQGHAVVGSGLLPLSHLSTEALQEARRAAQAKGRPAPVIAAELALRTSVALSAVALCLLGLAVGVRLTRLGPGIAAASSLGLVCGYFVLASLVWQAVNRGFVAEEVLAFGLPALVCAVAVAVGAIRR